jgi:hypothetical protein
MSGWERAFQETKTAYTGYSLPAGIGDAQVRHLDEKVKELTARIAELLGENTRLREDLELTRRILAGVTVRTVVAH